MNFFCVFSRCLAESSSESECETDEDSTCSSSSDSEVFDVIAEIKRKKAHPDRLHDELWYNDPGQVRAFLCFRYESCKPTHHIYDSGLRRCMLAGIETEPYSRGCESLFRAISLLLQSSAAGCEPRTAVPRVTLTAPRPCSEQQSCAVHQTRRRRKQEGRRRGELWAF